MSPISAAETQPIESQRASPASVQELTEGGGVDGNEIDGDDLSRKNAADRTDSTNSMREEHEQPQQQQASSASTSTSSSLCTSIGVLRSHTNAHKETVLNKLGGKDMLRKAVDRFYDHLVHDEHCELKQFFARTNIQLLKWHQYNFMSIAFTNPEYIVADNFDIRSMILKRHEELFDIGLNETHYDTMMDKFVETLNEMGRDDQAVIDKDYIDEALEVLYPLRAVFAQGAKMSKERKDARTRRNTILQLTTTTTFITILATIVFGIFRTKNSTSNSSGIIFRGWQLLSMRK